MTDLLDLAAKILERAAARGADDAEVYLRRGRETDITVRNGEVELLNEGAPKSVGIRLWREDCSASTYSTDFSEAAIERVLSDTLEMIPLTDPVPESALPDAGDMVREFDVPELFDPSVPEITAEQKLEMATALEEAALSTDERVAISGGASYGDLMMEHALANSRGLSARYDESYLSLVCEALADDADGKKRNGMWYSVARFAEDLDDPASVGERAARRAADQIGAGPIPTAELPVIFDPTSGGQLLAALFSVIKGGAIERGASYLADALGESIGSELLTVIDDPTLPRAPGSRPFDGEGLPARRTVFVDGGRLESFALNHYHARKLGLEATGHASRPASGPPGETSSNLYLAPGQRTPQALIGEVERGLYVESMMGFGFNPVTGDFSRGAAGRLIEDGELTTPVCEVTVSANFADIFARLDAVANDLEHRRSTITPTFRIARMTVGGG